MSWKKLFIKPDLADEPGAQGVSAGNSRSVSTPPPPTRSTQLLDDFDVPRKARPISPVVVTEPDPASLAELQKALGGAMTVGFNEFCEQLDVVDDDVTDRKKAINMTLRLLAKAKPPIPVQQVLASMRERLEILGNEKARFDSELASLAQQKAAEGRQAVDSAKNQIAEIDKEIVRLQAERAKNQTVVDAGAESDKALATKVANAHARYDSAYSHLSTNLSQLLNEVQQLSGAQAS